MVVDIEPQFLMYSQLPNVVRYTEMYSNNILITLTFYLNSASLAQILSQPKPLHVNSDNRKECQGSSLLR